MVSEQEQRGLCAQNMSKSFQGRAVVKEVNLEVCQGEIIGLLGPNGAGKTTTFYMLAGLIQSDQGRITLNGKDVTDWPIHLRAVRGLGYLPQEASVFRDLTVEENINAVLEMRTNSRARKNFLSEKLLKDFGLENIRHSKGRMLSGGERRRVEIARVLALRPKFILLDEPFAGVDPLAVRDVQSIIGDLRKRNIGVLITDHNVRETLDIVDRAYIMRDGQLLTAGTPEEIIRDPQVRKLYLGESFSM